MSNDGGFLNIMSGLSVLGALIVLVVAGFAGEREEDSEGSDLANTQNAAYQRALENNEIIYGLEIGADDYYELSGWVAEFPGIKPMVVDSFSDGFVSKSEFEELSLQYHDLRLNQAKEHVMSSVGIGGDFNE